MHLITACYFEYDVTLDIAIRTPGFARNMSLHTCIRYTDILDYERIRKDNSARNLSQSSSHRTMQHVLTIDEIFKYTPDTNDFMKSAKFRTQDSFKMHQCSGLKCSSLFNVKKIVHSEYVCYSIQSVFPSTGRMVYQTIIATPSSGGEILRIILSTAFKATSIIKIFIHDGTHLPYESFLLAPVRRRGFKRNTGNSLYNSFVVSYALSVTDRLPPPYQDNCLSYRTSQLQSIQECVTKKVIEKYAKIPFTVMLSQPVNKSMISLIDVINQTLSSQLISYQFQCELIYTRPDCSTCTWATNTIAQIDDEFMIILMTSNSPVILVNSKKKMPFSEYLTLVTSTFSMWTGLAIVSFDPIKLFSNVRRKLLYLAKIVPQSQYQGVISETKFNTLVTSEIRLIKTTLSELSIQVASLTTNSPASGSAFEKSEIQIQNTTGHPFAPQDF